MSLIWFLTGPFLYFAAGAFAAGAAWRLVRLARLPRHLRWELYPLPRLGPEGSKYQQVDFAQARTHGSHVREAVFMAEEILLLKKVFQHRRDLWLGSWMMHAGLYAGAVFLGLLLAGAAADQTGCLRSEGGLRAILDPLTVVLGWTALPLGLAGCVLLLLTRLRDPGLRAMGDRPTYLNLGLVSAIFASGLVACATADPHFTACRQHLGTLLCGSPGSVPVVLAMPLVLFGGFLTYLPFSRMFHFAAKYFTYHWILWESEAMRPGSALEREIATYLAFRTNWSAAHMRPGASWADQARPARERREP